MIEPPPAAAEVGQAGDGVAEVADQVGVEHRVPRLVASSPTARASWRTPALETSASRPPSFATAALHRAATAAPSRASAHDELRARRALRPRARGSRRDRCRRRRLPRHRNRSTIDAPMPDVPPVTSARIPSQSRHRAHPPTRREDLYRRRVLTPSTHREQSAQSFRKLHIGVCRPYKVSVSVQSTGRKTDGGEGLMEASSVQDVSPEGGRSGSPGRPSSPGTRSGCPRFCSASSPGRRPSPR